MWSRCPSRLRILGGAGHRSARCRLVASATFLDALSYVKPGIYLRNPYVEYYFEQMGDIGYLCDSYEEMREVVLAILSFPLPDTGSSVRTSSVAVSYSRQKRLLRSY